MKSKMVLLMIVCALCAIFSNTVRGQSAPPAATPEPSSPPKGLKTVILEVKNRDTNLLARLLRGLSSGDRYSEVSANLELKAITVRDFPENIAVMQDALKRLDMAEAEKPNLEVQLYLIAATPTAAENEPLLPQLEPVFRQFKQALKYKGYRHVTTFVNRVKVGGNVYGEGKINLFGQPSSSLSYSYKLGGIQISSDLSGNNTVQIGVFNLMIPGAGTIGTELSIREGEMVAVGTSNIGDNGIIAVVSVKKVQ